MPPGPRRPRTVGARGAAAAPPMLRLRPLLALLPLLAACTGIEVRSQHEPGTDFAALTTYAWAPAIAANEREDLVLEIVRPKVDALLAARGLTKVERDQASLVVEEHVVVEKVTRTNDPYYAFDLYTEYERGTLLVDLMDPATSKVLWRGSATAEIDGEATEEQRRERVEGAVERMFEGFPPE